MNRRRSIRQLASIFAGRLPAKPDWLGILEFANGELITPELYGRLRELEAVGEIPQDLCIFLDEMETRVRDRMRRLADTLQDALVALGEEGITPVLLKGSAMLAESDPRERPARARILSDVDLLVRPGDVPGAITALQSAGFAVIEDNRHDPAHEVVILARSTDVGAIDLHQNVPGPPGVVNVCQLQARSRRMNFRGMPVKVAAPEDQLLLLVMHDQFQDGHFWRGGFNFRHLLDIARIASASRPVNWAIFSSMCNSRVLRVAAAAQLAAARGMVAASIPQGAVRSVWGIIHYWRQRAQLTWPLLNRAFNKAGISKNVWKDFTARFLAPSR